MEFNEEFPLKAPAPKRSGGPPSSPPQSREPGAPPTRHWLFWALVLVLLGLDVILVYRCRVRAEYSKELALLYGLPLFLVGKAGCVETYRRMRWWATPVQWSALRWFVLCLFAGALCLAGTYLALNLP